MHRSVRLAGTLLLGAEAWVFLASAAACVFLGATAAGAGACHAWMAGLNRRRDDRRRSVVAIGDRR